MKSQGLLRFFLCIVDGKEKWAKTFCLSKNENGLNMEFLKTFWLFDLGKFKPP
jgi:hypothetical protein